MPLSSSSSQNKQESSHLLESPVNTTTPQHNPVQHTADHEEEDRYLPTWLTVEE